MIWIIIISLVIFLVSLSRLNSRKTVLNDAGRELFYKYRGMIDNKVKRPEVMTEWELKIWELALKDKEAEGEKKFWIGAVIFGIVLLVSCYVINIYQ